MVIKTRLAAAGSIYHSEQGGRHINIIYPPLVSAGSKTAEVGQNTAADANEQSAASNMMCEQKIPNLLYGQNALLLLICMYGQCGKRKVQHAYTDNDHLLAVVPRCKGHDVIMYVFAEHHQMLTRFSGAIYIGDSGVTFHASYHASICGRAPFTRQRPSE